MIRSVARLDGTQTDLRPPLSYIDDLELRNGVERRPLRRVVGQHQDIHEALHGKTEVNTDPNYAGTWNLKHATGQALAYVQLRA
ncbi:hypothetical protein [Micromonospora sp. WMMD1274]|uniref:hypothetical protein n=1 Tax=Micromonospora sp. WMMD1274 TaxID=3404116 RepID=UPI003B934D20